MRTLIVRAVALAVVLSPALVFTQGWGRIACAGGFSEAANNRRLELQTRFTY